MLTNLSLPHPQTGLLLTPASPGMFPALKLRAGAVQKETSSAQHALPTVSLLRNVICTMLPSCNTGAITEKPQLYRLSDSKINVADLEIPTPGTSMCSFLPDHTSSEGSCPRSSFF